MIRCFLESTGVWLDARMASRTSSGHFFIIRIDLVIHLDGNPMYSLFMIIWYAEFSGLRIFEELLEVDYLVCERCRFF